MVAVLTASPTWPKVRPPVGTASSRRYERRRPEKTPLYKIVSEHLEGWLENQSVAEHPVSAHVERELRSYLTCGILCFGFGRARCTSCGQGFVVAFSCRGRGVCPSCNGRRMAQTPAHLVDRVIPPVPVRQWVISLTRVTASQPPHPCRPSSALVSIYIGACIIERMVEHRREIRGSIDPCGLRCTNSCHREFPRSDIPDRPDIAGFSHRPGRQVHRAG